MAVRVDLRDGVVHHYSKGDKWFIDDYRQLHILDSDKVHRAAIASDEWVAVCDATDEAAE